MAIILISEPLQISYKVFAKKIDTPNLSLMIKVIASLTTSA